MGILENYAKAKLPPNMFIVDIRSLSLTICSLYWFFWWSILFYIKKHTPIAYIYISYYYFIYYVFKYFEIFREWIEIIGITISFFSQEGVRLASEIVWIIWYCNKHYWWLLWHTLDRDRYWKYQYWTCGISRQVCLTYE